MGSFNSLTEGLIARTPLARNSSLDQVVAWIRKVVPCGQPGYVQSQHDTDLVIGYLRWRAALDPALIAAALDHTGYVWTLGPRHFEMSVAMRMLEIKKDLDRQSQKGPSMGVPGRVDIGRVKMRAQELDVRYSANRHDPKLQGDIRNELISLLDLLLKTGEPMHDMLKERDRMREMREEVLTSAGNLGREVRLQLGPLALQRLREPMPKPSTPWRPPNLVTPRR